MGTPAYDKLHVRWINLKFNLKTDADILTYLDSKQNKQGYIKQLIRADIAAHGGGSGASPCGACGAIPADSAQK